MAGLGSNGSFFHRVPQPGIEIDCVDETDKLAHLQPETVALPAMMQEDHQMQAGAGAIIGSAKDDFEFFNEIERIRQ